MIPPILILAVGNESRGDDALAPLLLRGVEAWLEAEGHADGFELIEDFQLQVEHATDMKGRKIILFIDAGMDTPEPHAFYRAQPGNSTAPFSHALTPEAVLAVYPQIYGESPPPAFILCLRGEQFELGSVLSPTAARRLDGAMNFMRQLLRETEIASWDKYAFAKKHETCAIQ